MINIIKDSLKEYNRDTKFLLAFNGIISMLVAFKAVFIPIYLLTLNLSPFLIGIYLTISTASANVSDVVFAFLSDRFGRKKILLVNVFLSSFLYIIPLLTVNDKLIFISAFFNFQMYKSYIVNALLADYSSDKGRTSLFTVKLFSSSLFAIIGPLMAGLPPIFQRVFNLDVVTSYKPLFVLGLGFTILCLFFLYMTTEKTIIRSKEEEKFKIPRDQYIRIAKFSVTNALDLTAVGITLTIFSLWFTVRFNVGIGVVSLVFAFAQFVETFAYLIAPVVGSRFGNVKGTVIIRAVGFVLIILLGFAPTPLIAALLYTIRNAIQRASHPLRDSYMMAVLDPKVRASGQAIIGIPRTITSTFGPSVGGYLLGISAVLPPIVSGTIFAVGDVLYWLFFKDLKPPEEIIEVV